MTELFKKVTLSLMTPKCYDEYFINLNFFHGECMKSTISTILGLIITAASITVKVPQILKIIKHKSGEGISLLGVTLELCSVSSFFLYSYARRFPFSSWGDGLFMAIQTAVMIGFIFYYKSGLTHVVLFLSIYSAVVFFLVTGIIPVSFLWFMQIMNLPIIILGKGAQAVANYRSQSTGQLSAITCWMQFGGATARVFTSFQETGDLAIIFTFVVASVLNGIIVFQLQYYAKSAEKKRKGKGNLKGKKLD